MHIYAYKSYIKKKLMYNTIFPYAIVCYVEWIKYVYRLPEQFLILETFSERYVTIALKVKSRKINKRIVMQNKILFLFNCCVTIKNQVQ